MLSLVSFSVVSAFNFTSDNILNSQPDKLFLVCAINNNSTTHSNTITICLSKNKSPNQNFLLVNKHGTKKTFHNKCSQEGEFKSISLFNKQLMAFINSNKLELASKLIANLSSYDLIPNCWTYSIIIRYYCKNSEPLEAKRLIDDILDKGFRPNVATFTVLVNEFCKEGKVEKALEVIETMGRISCEPNIYTYNCLLKGFCYVGKVEEAYEFLAKLKDKFCIEPDIYTYTAVMDGFCKVGRSNEAFELLDEALKLGLVPNVVTYNTLFTGFFREGKPLEGLALLKLMKESNCMPDYTIYSTLLHGLLKWGEVNEALGVYKEMVRISFVVDERMMNTLFRGLCRRSRREKELLSDAYDVFDKMIIWGIEVYDFTFDLVIEAFCRGGKSYEALASLEKMIGLGYNPKETTFRYVIRALCVEGKVESALKVLFIYQEKGSFSRTSLSIMINELKFQGNVVSSFAVYGLSLKLGLSSKCYP